MDLLLDILLLVTSAGVLAALPVVSRIGQH
jgi:hypothetical protein